MSRKISGKVLSLLLVTIAFSGACEREKRASRDCTYDGSEKFGITVDGRFRGAFADYLPAEGPDGIAIFRNGLIPAGADLRNSPNESRDVTVFNLEQGKAVSGAADLIGTKFITVNGLTSKNEDGCIVVDELVLQVSQTQEFSGVLTAPDQAAEDSAPGADAAEDEAPLTGDDIAGDLDDDLE